MGRLKGKACTVSTLTLQKEFEVQWGALSMIKKTAIRQKLLIRK